MMGRKTVGTYACAAVQAEDVLLILSSVFVDPTSGKERFINQAL